MSAMKRTLRVWAISLLASFGLAGPSSAGPFDGANYYYAPVDAPGAGFRIDQTAGVVATGDVARKAKFCKANYEYICFTSDDLSFAVPHVAKAGDNWTYAGKKFALRAGPTHYRVLGQEVGLSLYIDSPDQRLVFLFSRERGLVAITRQDGGGTLLLTERCGFGAALTC